MTASYWAGVKTRKKKNVKNQKVKIFASLNFFHMSDSTEQVAKVETPVDNTIVETSTDAGAEYPPSVHKVHRQLLIIFDPENIAKDNFFRELVERTPEGCKAHF